jgi:SP family general alpha glucoside:H+ symporter-like MFS transporter
MDNDIETNKPTTITAEPSDGVSKSEMPKPDQMLIDIALEGTEIEHSLGPLEAAQLYWKGVMFAVIISLSIVMRIYDILVVNAFFALPAFRNRFGIEVPGHGKQIPAAWQAALGNANVVGQVIGAFLVSYPMERFGRRYTLMFSLVATSGLIFMQFYAPSLEVLTASEYLSGVIWGFYQVLIPTYSSEILPTVLRPYLAGYINTCYSIGGLILNGVTAAFDVSTSDWGWRIPFALQWMWPAIILPILIFTPDSPWWLVRKGRLEEAEKALRRLSSSSPKVDVSKTLAMMQKTDLYEQKVETGSSVWDCFKGVSRRRTEIVIMIFFVQDFAGSPTSTTYFFEQLGITTKQSFDISIGNSALALVATCSAVILLRYFGRRSTYIGGVSALCVLELLVAFLCLAPNYSQRKSLAWGQVGLAMMATIAYQITIGPLGYTILTEIPSTRLRSKTVGVAIAADAVFGIITSTVQPYLLNPGEANAGAKTNFLWGGISIFSLIWCYFRLPETKHRTFEEIDYMFENKVNTRDFKGYHIDEDTLKHDLE